jgi:drug/metabolite transporter (DMT)-like permease
VSDFVGGIASRRVPALRVVLVSYPVSVLLLLIMAGFAGGEISGQAIFWGSLCGISQAFGVWWFYAALAEGPISVVSPLTAILVAGVPVGVGMAMGERPTLVADIGIVIALLAVYLVSRDASDEDVTPHRFTKKVAWLTVGSGLLFGLNFVLIHQAPHEANLWPLVFARASASLLIVVIAIAARHLHLPTGQPMKLALAAGTIDAVSNVAMLLALQASLLSLASVLMSLYPAATVALAMVVLKERVTRWQALGMVLALIAVAMIAVG